MKYWLTIQWPPREGSPEEFERSGVYLSSEHADIRSELEPGDLVLIYETKSDPEVRRGNAKVGFLPGRQGIRDAVRVVSPFQHCERATEIRADGTEKTWEWKAETESVAFGFVPLGEVNRILGLGAGNVFRSWGRRGSGLREITQQEYEALREAMMRSAE